MKKLLGFLGVLLMISSCTEKFPLAKEFSCTEWSAECELQKDRMLIQPITLDSIEVFDAYANPVTIDSTRWYIVNTKLGVLAPIWIEVTLSCGPSFDSPCKKTWLPTVTQLEERDWKGNKGQFRIERVSLAGIVPGVQDAYLVVVGPNEVFAVNHYAELARPALAEK